MDKDKVLKPLVLLAVIIIFCSVLIRLFSGSETLAEYADKNPEIAYQEQEPEHPYENNTIIDGADTQNDSTSAANEYSDNKTPHVLNHTEKDPANNIADKNQNSGEESEDITMTANPDRTVYKEGFYYEPLSEEIIKRITGISYPVTEEKKDSTSIEAINIVQTPEDILIAYEDLCYVSVLHYNFKGIERPGELICNQAIAQDLVEIFYELYRNEYQIEQIHLIDEYNGDDTLSMLDNNTSCFNYRVVDGTANLSKHALGLAIDINPFFNPYVVFKKDGSTYISPQGSETYADRSKDFAYKIDENDLCYKLFKEHGFVWGGDWNSCKDYQHFQKVPEE